MLKVFLFLVLFISLGYADEFDDGFEEESEEVVIDEIATKPYYIIGNIQQQANYATHNQTPHNNLNSFKSSLYLESEYNFNENHKLRVSAKAFYDSIYKIQSDRAYTEEEKDDMQSEAEIFDLYVQGKITANFDYKIGRQIVVWGRSDTIRVTDILNPLDNRSPGIIDIEDLRLPVGMAKFDYYFGEWGLSAIVIGETRYSKNPSYGSDFYPFASRTPDIYKTDKPSYALSLSGTFSGWDVSLYGAKTTVDELLSHDEQYMLGYAFNYIYESWLFKSEGAYFDKYKLQNQQDKTFSNVLVGFEYNGINETVIAFDISNKFLPDSKDVTQSALRLSSDFQNDTLKVNYLVSLYGRDFSEGGFQRVWFDYEINDTLSSTIGYVDYVSGTPFFDVINDNDMFFTSVKYSF